MAVLLAQKRGTGVRNTKRGEGLKLMAVTGRSALTTAIGVGSATPHEVTLVESTLGTRFITRRSRRLIGDRAYDSGPLDQRLLKADTIMIAPHKRNRKQKKTQDGSALCRYRRRWVVERLFAWLHNFRRMCMRHDYKLCNYQSFVVLGCIMILMRQYF